MNEPAVVVTGASTGIGRAAALHLDSLGLRVFAGVRKDSDGESLSAAASKRLVPLRLDITDPSFISIAAEVVTREVRDSRLLGVVNNAGIAVAGPLEFVPLDDFRRQLEVNVTGQLAVTQAFIPLLRESRGRVVFVSSVAGKFSQPFAGPYCASKHALEALADALRVEMRPWSIDVSLIEPGAVATPIWDKGLEMADAMMESLPRRIHELYGTAIEVAKTLSRREAENGVPPQQVALAIAEALTAPRPKTRYVVGRDAKMMLLARRILSDRLRDALIFRVSGLPKTEADVRSRPARVKAASGSGH